MPQDFKACVYLSVANIIGCVRFSEVVLTEKVKKYKSGVLVLKFFVPNSLLLSNIKINKYQYEPYVYDFIL